MAPTERPFADRLIEDLSEHGMEYDFLHALRRLRQVFPEDPPLGSATRPGQESVRLHQSVSLNFAPTGVERVALDEATQRLGLWTYGFGLTGPNGPLPLALTEYVLERKRHHNDSTLEGFLNIFHHRMIALLYRSWALNNPVVDYENGDGSRFYRLLRSLVGIGTEAVTNRDHVDDHAKVFHAGLMCPAVRSAEGLESILSSYFEMPARIQPFRGEWLTLPAEAQSRIGASPSTGSLGVNMIVGSMIWECQIRFRIVFGPLSMADFQRLLPGQPAFQRLRDWVRLYAGLAFEWEAQLILGRDEVRPIQLGAESFLGWTTWMVSQPVAEDRDDLILPGD
jgi:type VI secretion system protein ImpH